MKPGLRMMNGLMRFTTSYFSLTEKCAGWRMQEKRTNQKINLQAAEAQYQKHKKAHRYQKNKDF